MPNYDVLSNEIAEKIKEKHKGEYKTAIRRDENPRDEASAWRTAYIRDIDKIMHSPYFNRYANKTQVFSLRKNDDITRRALHVQYVSRTARTIGRALDLDLDLIEAIAVGHDIGHTPFGHAGEKYLDEILKAECGRRFHHNIHSVRVLDGIFPINLTLDTLNGIAAHDGENERAILIPKSLDSFEVFDKQIKCINEDVVCDEPLWPSTLEACVVRISDIIAYLGKDRQDAIRAGLNPAYKDTTIGTINAEIINNLIVNIIENSYGKDCIAMDEDHFNGLKLAKKENYDLIYNNTNLSKEIGPMMEKMYKHFKEDLNNKNRSSFIYTHHIKDVNDCFYRKDKEAYENEDIDQIVVDYIASMTDSYFVDMYKYLFGNVPKGLSEIGYFE